MNKTQFDENTIKTLFSNVTSEELEKAFKLNEYFKSGTIHWILNEEGALYPLNKEDECEQLQGELFQYKKMSKSEKVSVEEYIERKDTLDNLLNIGEYNEGYNFCNELIQKTNSSHWNLLSLRVFTLSRLREYQAAINELDRLIQRVETNHKMVNNLYSEIEFNMEIINRNRKSAIEDCRVMDVNKVLADCWCQKGTMIYQLSQDPDKAIIAYKMAKKYNDLDPVLNINLLKIYGKQDNLKDAKQLFVKNRENPTFFNLCKKTTIKDIPSIVNQDWFKS